MQRALFVTHQSHIGASPGGVQTCTREFISSLQAAQIALEVVEITHDMSPATRARRQLNSSPYFQPISRSSQHEIVQRMKTTGAKLLFLNQVALAGAIPALRAQEPWQTVKIALSHGCEITDLLHLARLRKHLPLSSRLRPSAEAAIANVLKDEIRARHMLDGVVSISAYDSQTESWLGTRHAAWLPRIVTPMALDWKPHKNRFGFVGTLDHAPNLEGLEAVLVAIAAAKSDGIRIRIVGGPDRIGKWLAGRFAFVDYLGALDEQTLQLEALSWRAFLNPIFCQARGCSTKIATALSWGIPIVTTEYGRRGYLWTRGSVIEANTPVAFAAQLSGLLSDEAVRNARNETLLAADSTPSPAEVASRLRTFLDEVEASASGSARA